MRNNSASNIRNDDFIPSEEPLINVREFWDANLSHSYRMRMPNGLQNTRIGMRANIFAIGRIQGSGVYAHYPIR